MLEAPEGGGAGGGGAEKGEEQTYERPVFVKKPDTTDEYSTLHHH